MDNNYRVEEINFINSNIGFAKIANNSSSHIIKTTDKGKTFQTIASFNSPHMSFDFFSEFEGVYIHSDKIYRTISGGNSWTAVDTLYGSNENASIRYVSQNVIYCAFFRSYNFEIYKSTNSGENWGLTNVTNWYTTGFQRIYSLDIKSVDNNPDKVILTLNKGQSSNDGVILLTNDGFSSYPTNYNLNSQSIGKFDVRINNSYFTLTSKGIFKFSDNISSSFQSVYSINQGYLVSPGIKFANENKGFAAISNGNFLITTNSGNNWSVEHSNQNFFGHSGMDAFNDIVYFGSHEGKFYTRTLGVNLISKKDNSNFNHSINFDGNYYNTSALYYLRGGSSTLNADPVINANQNNEAIFYKWNFNEMRNPIQGANLYYFDSPGTIESNYKTKNISTENSAISRAGLTKSFKDSYGVIQQVHSSIGGIFYSRSTNNGNSFSREEVVNYHSNDKTADNNINPTITEIKSQSSGYINPNQNVLATWQRNEGNSGKIKLAYRRTIDNQNYFWQHLDNEYFIDINATNFNAMAKSYGFKLTANEEYPRFVLTSYLKPVQNGVQLVVNRRTTTIGNPDPQVIDEGNITEYSSEVNYISNGGLVEMHLSYIKNGQVYYKFIKFSVNGVYEDPTPVHISSDDGFLYNRNSVDISLRNTRPVITYAGAYDMSKIVIHENSEEENNNESQLINLNFYPIVVKYKKSDNNWSQSFRYNSSGNTTQQNPDVEGSLDQNAHILNYSVNNTNFKKFVRIDDPNYANYYCSPSYFYGKDAKLIKGSYEGLTGGNPTLLTLSDEPDNLYKVAKKNFSITNNQNPEHDRAFSNLFGTFDISGINYMFNLGPIIVRNITEDLDDNKNNIYIQNLSDFNEYLESDIYLLNNGDTLILGTTGIYRNESNNEFAPVKYRVDLINKSFESIHRVLFYDTIDVNDSVEVNFLRGFVINDIPNGSDSFYVKIEIDPQDSEGAGEFGVGGEYPSEPSEGDNQPYKTKIFFESDSPVSNSITPTQFSLSQNFPNPFNPVTNIAYQIPVDGLVKLKVYDILGKEVATLVNEIKQVGTYQVSFNGSNLSSGIYFYKIQSGNFTQVKRMVLVK